MPCTGRRFRPGPLDANLAGALLTDLLLPLVPTHGRIVNVASATHQTATLELDDLSFEHRPCSAALLDGSDDGETRRQTIAELAWALEITAKMTEVEGATTQPAPHH